jgi:hypothetical protein
VQRSPLGHDPLAHTPPHPSSAPHAFPPQLGVQPQIPGCPPPPHERSGDVQAFWAQQDWPFPPQFAHVVPHVVPGAQATHATPPLPHDVWSFPCSQAPALQHPSHEVTSHLHTPATHRRPLPHAPWVHTSLHPSLAPQAFPSQEGVHLPAPQWFGTPPPPQS